MHPNIEYFILSLFWVETQKLKIIACGLRPLASWRDFLFYYRIKLLFSLSVEVPWVAGVGAISGL